MSLLTSKQSSEKEQAAHIYSPEYYARLAEMDERHWWSLGVRAIATKLLDRYAPTTRDWKVLDAGCGTGLTLSWLKRYTDIEPMGFDLSRSGLEFCAQRDHKQLVETSTLAIPFASEYFDLVVSLDVLQHLPRPGGDRDALSEIARVVKRGGLFLLRTNSACGYPPTKQEDYQRYALSEICTILTDAGFQIEIATYINFLPGLLATARQLVAQPNTRNTDPGLGMIPRPPESSLITRLMYLALQAESAYLAPGRPALPFGHSILALAQKSI